MDIDQLLSKYRDVIERKKGEQKVYPDLEGKASKTASNRFSEGKNTQEFFKTYAHDDFA